MSADALELVFTGSAVLGTALLLLSSIGGGMHVRVHVPMRLPHLHVPFVHVSRADNATGMPMLLGLPRDVRHRGAFRRRRFRSWPHRTDAGSGPVRNMRR